MSKNNASKFTPKAEASETKRFLFASLAGSLLALICTLALTLITSAFVLTTPDPDSLTTLAAYIIAAVSLFAAGVCAVRLSDGNIIAALAAGAVFTLAAFCVHLVVTAKNTGSDAMSLLFLAFPLVAMLGGLIGRPRPKKKQKFKSR